MAATKTIEKLEALKPFLGRQQQISVAIGLRGKERGFFKELVDDLTERVALIPRTESTKSTAFLHYFKGNMDFYITELDTFGGRHEQAFGHANLGFSSGGELGYISLKEITDMDVELDFHFTPKPLDAALGITQEQSMEPE